MDEKTAKAASQGPCVVEREEWIVGPGVRTWRAVCHQETASLGSCGLMKQNQDGSREMHRAFLGGNSCRGHKS